MSHTRNIVEGVKVPFSIYMHSQQQRGSRETTLFTLVGQVLMVQNSYAAQTRDVMKSRVCSAPSFFPTCFFSGFDEPPSTRAQDFFFQFQITVTLIDIENFTFCSFLKTYFKIGLAENYHKKWTPTSALGPMALSSSTLLSAEVVTTVTGCRAGDWAYKLTWQRSVPPASVLTSPTSMPSLLALR